MDDLIGFALNEKYKRLQSETSEFVRFLNGSAYKKFC